MPQDIKDFVAEVKRKLCVFDSNKFLFEEEDHRYTYSGERLDSVTTFLKTFKEPFLRDYWASKKAAERGISKDAILNEWKEKADVSTRLGTAVHKWIENFWTDEEQEFPEDQEVAKRIHKFMKIHDEKLKIFHHVASERKIFSTKWGLAGTIDEIFAFHDEKLDRNLLVIGDWKSNAEFKTSSHEKGRYKKLLRPFNDLYENHLNEYSIQLSLYRLILEQSGVETHSGFLCHIGPEGDAKIYKAVDLRERLKIYLDENRKNRDIFSLD
jgi:hypothetical protein